MSWPQPRARRQEQWMAARGGLMLGMGRAVAGERVDAREHMRIEEEGDRAVNP